MEKEEVELLPCELITCLLGKREVRVVKISPKKLTIRTSEEIKDIDDLIVAFFIFDEYRYDEVEIKDYTMMEKKQGKFYITYAFSIDNKEYENNVRRVIKDYSKYVKLKNFGCGNEFSEEMVGYPAEKDYEFYDYFVQQKKELMISINNYENYNDEIMKNIELAIKLDNDILYDKYLKQHIKTFKDQYLKENFGDNHKLFKKDVTRIYVGNEFCHNLFPAEDILMKIFDKAESENINITLCFTYMRECYIEETKKIIDKVYKWCSENEKCIEVVINDWGMIELLRDKDDYISLCLGVLLNKRKKDPRYMYKKGYDENKELMSENSLNSNCFIEFMKENNINRYEYENCGYRIKIAEGNHSLHMPFYVTNTSQYCTLYAMCTNLDRGKQKLVTKCPKYCRDYIFSYPKHLKMVGRYNSLFAFDDTLIKDYEQLEYYIKNGIDRIVLNFI